MARVCQVTGKRPLTGNKVSHANNKTKRRFLPNIQNHKFWDAETKRFVKLKLTARGLRTVDKLGIQTVLEQIKARKQKKSKS
jgi:large subunit ribosomal protein L28